VILELVGEAQASGARLGPACHMLGVSARTVERWRAEPEACAPQKLELARSNDAAALGCGMIAA